MLPSKRGNQSCRPKEKSNLYPVFFQQLHPLTTTGLAPVIILAVLNVRICRGIAVLNRKRQTFTANDVSRSNVNNDGGTNNVVASPAVTPNVTRPGEDCQCCSRQPRPLSYTLASFQTSFTEQGLTHCQQKVSFLLNIVPFENA